MNNLLPAVVLGKATALLALAWAVHAALAGKNPQWRVGLWRSVTVGLAVICGLVLAPPFLIWRLERSDAASGVFDGGAARQLASSQQAFSPDERTNGDHLAVRTDVERVVRSEPGPGARKADASARVVGEPRALARPSVRRPAGSYGFWLLLVWGAGVLVLLARVVASGWQLARVIRRSKDAPAWVCDEARAIAASLGVMRDIRVLHAAEVVTPCLAGLRKPVVLLPPGQCDPAGRTDLRAILSHELAHARTHDLTWNAAIYGCSMLLWFHPLAWRVRAAHAAACDAVCDSAAACQVGDVISYCRTLARLALQASGEAIHGLAMTRTSDVSRRIKALNREVFGSLPMKAALAARVAVGGLAILIGGLGFTRAGAAAAPRHQGGQAADAKKLTPPAANSPLDALDRAQIDPYELSVAGAGNPAAAPPDLVAILGNSRLKMHRYVQAMAFTVDGRNLIGAGDAAIRLWDPQSGSQQRALAGHTDLVFCLAVSANGTTLVSGSSDRTVKVWDLATGKERLTLAGSQGGIATVAISPDGTRIASGDFFSTIRLWNGADGREIMVLKGHGKPVTALAFSPDGKTLASGGDDGTIRLWDVASGRTVKTLDRAPERWRALAFSPDGKTLAGGGYDHGLVLWDTITWAVRLHVREVDNLGVTALAFTRDGGRLALMLGFAARIIDEKTGAVVREFPKESMGSNALALSRDDSTLATAGLMVRLWDVASGRETTPELPGHRNNINSLAFSLDGGQLATASLDGTVRLWELNNRRSRLTLAAFDHSANGVAFRPDGKVLVSIGFGPDLILWDLPGGKKMRTLKGEGEVSTKVFFSPDGRWLAAEALNRMRGNIVNLWDSETGQLHSTLEAGAGTCFFSPDSKKLIVVGNGVWSLSTHRIIVWDIAGKKAEQTMEAGELPARLGAGALSPDGRVLALTAIKDSGHAQRAVVILWGLVERRPIYQLDCDERAGATRLAFAADGRTLLGVGRDGLARVWDPRNGTLREKVQIAEPGQFVIRDIAFAPDGRHFAAALGNGTARIFRLARAPEVVEPRAAAAVARAKPETSTEPWKRLIGKPAPDLRQIRAWDGGTPVTMADLRGRFVVLHFWHHQSPNQLGGLMALHDQFADQGKGLVIIVVQPDRGQPATSFRGWESAISSKQRRDREVPFRLALDGGGATVIPGTDVEAFGATHAAFGVAVSSTRGHQPVNIVIGPDGNIVEAGVGVRQLERVLEGAMGVKAKVPEWRRRFDEAYALRPGQVLKRVGPPYPAERADFAFYTVAGARDDPHYSYVLRWDGRPRMWGSKRGDLLRDNVLVFVLGFGKAEIVGPRELVEMHVPGDWVIRPGASKADLLKGLETILRDELKQPVTFTEREVERDVLVAKGRYQFHPLGDLPGETAVHLGTAALPSSEGGGGSGTLRQMLDWLGDRTNVMVVDEAEGFPAVSRIVWRDHLAEHAADIGANTEAGRSTLDRVLANLTKQTELTFHRERRRAKVWVVSRAQ